MAKHLGPGIDLDRAGMDITHDRRLGQQVQGGVDTDVAFDLAIDFHLLAQQIADDHGFTAHDQMLADRELTFDIGVIQLKIFTGDVAFRLCL